MIERPFFSESRRTPVCAVVALCIALVAVLLAAGCTGPDYQPNRNIGVVKITSEGVPEWSALIDTGGDDLPGDIIETFDGNYILAASSDKGHPSLLTSQLIKISHDGTVLWNDSVDKSICGSYQLVLGNYGKVINLHWAGPVCPHKSNGDYAENSSSNFTVRGSVVKTRDGGYILAGYTNESVPFTKEEFILRDQTEFQRTKEYAEERWMDNCNKNNSVRSWLCYNKPVFTATIVKINPDSTISWQHDFQNYSTSTSSVIEMNNGKGYLANFGNAIFRLTPDGTVTNVTILDKIPEYDPQPSGVHEEQNYSLLYQEKYTNVALLFEKDGMITRKEYLPGKIVTPTRDGGFTIVNARVMQSSTSSTILSFATKYNRDGSMAWEKHIASDNLFPSQTQVIQTSDGGYIILSYEDNASAKR